MAEHRQRIRISTAFDLGLESEPTAYDELVVRAHEDQSKE